MALGADRLLVKCYPQEALQFYKDMSVAAVRFGTSHDQAVLQGLMGMAITQGQGESGIGIMQSAQQSKKFFPSYLVDLKVVFVALPVEVLDCFPVTVPGCKRERVNMCRYVVLCICERES